MEGFLRERSSIGCFLALIYISSSWYDHEMYLPGIILQYTYMEKLKLSKAEAVIASLKKLVDKYEEILKNSVEDLSQNHDASSWNCSF
jgi:hypothetical protein